MTYGADYATGSGALTITSAVLYSSGHSATTSALTLSAGTINAGTVSVGSGGITVNTSSSVTCKLVATAANV